MVRQLFLEESDADHGWGKVGVGNFVVRSLGCYHGNILFEPFVAQVAERLNKYLKD